MGLAGRKNKQRIGADPRNLIWSDDSSKFGAKYLQSLGWSTGSGLGPSGEGRTSNVKIHQKLDLMGIGANRRGPGGDDAEWRGGREFEGLLIRLNQAQNEDTQDTTADVKSTPEQYDECVVGSPGGDESTRPDDQCLAMGVELKDGKRKRQKESGEKRKRKRSATEDDDDLMITKRKRKEEKREKKKATKATKGQERRQDPEREVHKSDLEVDPSTTLVGTPVETASTAKVQPRYRAHRARNLASKRLAATSVTSMNEILGIASSRSSENASGTSYIPFPSQVTPPRPSVWDAAVDDATPGLGLSRVKNRVDDADDTGADQISAMALGIRPAFGGLGFEVTRDDNGTDDTQESSGHDLIRKSGKSVAEYFAEKMRLKTISKERPASLESEAPKRKKRKEGK